MSYAEKWKLRTIAEVAPSLEILKKLPLERQAMLLLRRLATAYGSNSFGKMNFELSGYSADLISGYPPQEADQVKNYLLGAPWTYLVSHGFIRDNGQGFFSVTQEGFQAAQNANQTIISIEIRSALQLLHPDLRDYDHYFQENRLKEAVAAAFERYENRLNELRDHSRKPAVRGTAGRDIPPKLFQAKILKVPYRKLGLPNKRQAYESALMGIMSGGIGWMRNAYTHEKHRVPDPTPEEALELLFVASYLLRMVEYASGTPR
jgi:hypothetical protein